ncbi:MAG: hypothetical protein FWB74_04380 [Defluviitaleaceae bacterium]|nr:hypothetical protein [Defluviitaleaceae bacterium]
MDKEKKIWYCELYAQRLYTICMGMLQEAARAGEHGRGYGAVALEARNMADRIVKYTELLRFESADDDKFKGIIDCAVQLNFLAINTAIQAHNMVKVNMDFNIPKSMAVFADELRKLTGAFNELSGGAVWNKPFVIPETAQPAKDSERETIFAFTIGGAPLCEILSLIREIVYVPVESVEGGTFSLRGDKMPLIDCYKKANLPAFKSNFPMPSGDYQPVLILENKEGKPFALPIDDLDFAAIFYTAKGTDVPVHPSHPLSKYARHAWDAVAGGQLVFLDLFSTSSPRPI